VNLHFEKYQGTGNDFIMIDNRRQLIDAYSLPIPALCDRKFGIGADGVIVIENHETVDFNMMYFNPDGSQSFCGNGSRCAVAFAHSLEIINNQTTFLSTDGIHEASFEGGEIALKMHDVADVITHKTAFELNTGSPHFITFVDDVSTVDIITEAHKIRYSDLYKAQGINVNFVERQAGALKMRTYERGVEDETLSCGTGVTAAALAEAFSSQKIGKNQTIEILVEGGELSVKFSFDGTVFSNIYLIGPAKKTFTGDFRL
jgi:diaminopimelate epimerase